MDVQYEDEIVGTVLFRQNGRVKRYAIKIANNQVIVQYPLAGSFAHAHQFFVEHRNWVETTLRRKKDASPSFSFDENTQLETLTFGVKILRTSQNRFYGNIDRKSGRLSIFCPEKIDLGSAEAQESVKRILLNTLMIEAKRYLPERLRQLAQQYGFKYQNCQIRKMKSRWGSCSSSGSIHLSSLLMLLPSQLSDYVMLHELCHTLVMNHSERFYQQLDRVSERRSKELDAKLKQCSRTPVFSSLFA